MAWVETARHGLLMILDTDIDPNFVVRPTVDPLRFILSITLRFPLAKAAREPLRGFIRSCARSGDCEVSTIKITDRSIHAEILTKHRHRSRDERGKFLKQRFGGRPG